MIKKITSVICGIALFSAVDSYSVQDADVIFTRQIDQNDILSYRFLDADFIDDSMNVIVDKSGELSSVVDSLKRIRSLYDRGLRYYYGTPKTFSIVHIGDSHVQADIMTGITRHLMQNCFGSAGRGFISPLRLAGTNEPADYRITSNIKSWENAKVIQRNPKFDIGVGGVAIEPKIKKGVAEFNIELLKGDDFNSVSVFHNSDAPSVVEEERYCTDMGYDYDTPDFLTDIFLTERTTSLLLTADLNDKNYKTPIYYGFNLKNGMNGVFYHSIGVNGATFYNYNKNPLFFRQLSALEPGLVILSMGTNEASQAKFYPEQFRAEIDSFIRTLKADNPSVAVILTTPVGNYRKFRGKVEINDNIAAAADEIVAYATENNIAYWDLYRITGGGASAENMDRYSLFRADKLHFTEEGYRLQGELLYKAIVKLLE